MRPPSRTKRNANSAIQPCGSMMGVAGGADTEGIISGLLLGASRRRNTSDYAGACPPGWQAPDRGMGTRLAGRSCLWIVPEELWTPVSVRYPRFHPHLRRQRLSPDRGQPPVRRRGHPVVQRGVRARPSRAGGNPVLASEMALVSENHEASNPPTLYWLQDGQ